MLVDFYELEILAPAKINLFLAVKGKRPDGYHEVRTVMQKIDLTDRIVLSLQSSGINLLCPGSGLPEDKTNLVYQAVEAFIGHTGIKSGVRVVLHKNIPVAAGLGGGSSDAAAVLVGLNKLCAAGLSEDSLKGLAVPLGADVPFFVEQSGASLATGIGNITQRISPLRQCRLLLVNPGIKVSTKWVYDNFRLTSSANPYRLTCSNNSGGENSVAGLSDIIKESGSDCLFNDLETVTISRHKVIQDIKKKLKAAGAAAALMSGSGPTVFGIFGRSDQAKECFSSFTDQYQQLFLVRPLE